MRDLRRALALYLVAALGAPAASAQEAAPTSAEATVAPDVTAGQAVPAVLKVAGALPGTLAPARRRALPLTFALYAEPEGGTPLWLETQRVMVDGRGAYTVLLGSETPGGLPLDLFTGSVARWLEVKVEGETEADAGGRRILLASVPYALKAADAETLGGRSASDFVLAESLGPEEAGVIGDILFPRRITAVLAGPGLEGGGTRGEVTLSVAPAACPPGQALNALPFGCQPVASPGGLEAEAAARQAADTALQNNIDAEAAARAAADATLQGNLDSEAAARQAADAMLQNSVNNEAVARQAADHALQNNADNEAAARQAADTTLQNNINNEISARAAADNALQTSLSSEVAARQAADNALQNNINNEAGARASADGVLQANLNNEAAARQAADTALQNNINSEAVARQLGDIGDVRADSASFYQSVPPGQEIPQVLGPVGDERESVSPSNPLEFLAVTRGKDAIGRRGFRWQAVPDEETGEARLELQYRKEDGSLATVLSINHDGTISFPPGQAFPIEARPGNGLGHGRDAVIEEQKRRIDALMREVQELRALLNDR